VGRPFRRQVGLPGFGCGGFLFHVAVQGNGGSLVEKDGGGDVKALAEASDVAASELTIASQDL
jgi:hypothetical protein